MLIKEYRILLPMTVEEYRIAQLYMIQKKSRIDSHGAGSGVEIITNKPYTDGIGGSGQYTFKIYHIGSKIPVWIRSVLPTNALEAHEEAWNAYPQTKTRYSSPMMDRFSVEVETLYCNDAGTQDNIFKLHGDELKQRQIDVMNFVKDPVSSHDYSVEEDPKVYRSEKTRRGPLSDDWVEEYTRKGLPVMCAYKLCKVEFRYWGMQSRAERWIHDLALRNTMMRAHRQAWAWQDEWHGLTLDDIRQLEAEVALHLSAVMAPKEEESRESEEDDGADALSDDLYFDCDDASPPQSAKPSIIRWSSELMLGEGDSPPLTPFPASASAALLVIVFQGDLAAPEAHDCRTTDGNTFRSTIDSLVTRHYPQLKGRVHLLPVSVGQELSSVVSRLAAISPSFGLLHPSLPLVVSGAQDVYNDAVEGAIRRANDAYDDFLTQQPDFHGEVFCVGDAIGGMLLFESLHKMDQKQHVSISRHPSSVSTHSARPIIEGEAGGSLHEFDAENLPRHARNLSAPPSASYHRKKMDSLHSVDSINFPHQRLSFQPSTCFLLGCPLGLVLVQKKLAGQDPEALDACQVFNLYYPLDPCGSRIEPVLQSQLSLLPPNPVARYQRYPLGDGRSLSFDPSVDTAGLWGSKRIDHLLYCPNSMVALPSSALPQILHASYWESCDVAAFVLRQFVRGEDGGPPPLSSSSPLPLQLELPAMQWNKKRTRFKITNLSANHRANDVLVVSGAEQTIHAKFCYGPMDLVALTRERVSVYVCPQRGEWFLHETLDTDGHGRLSVSLDRSLPCGIHSVKMIVHGDHSFLDAFVAVCPPQTRCVVFSVDGSLTASVSVTGRDPKVRPGAVDVVRYWHEQGYLVIYVTARPDMQQRVVSAWLAQHNFPAALLFFTPSFSTDPLRQKANHLRHLTDIGMCIYAAYGSGKDVAVYSTAGLDQDHIVCVGGGGRRRGCIHIESYSAHLSDLTSAASPLVGDSPREDSGGLAPPNHRKTSMRAYPRPPLWCMNVQRTSSFTPRSGKYDSHGLDRR